MIILDDHCFTFETIYLAMFDKRVPRLDRQRRLQVFGLFYRSRVSHVYSKWTTVAKTTPSIRLHVVEDVDCHYFQVPPSETPKKLHFFGPAAMGTSPKLRALSWQFFSSQRNWDILSLQKIAETKRLGRP